MSRVADALRNAGKGDRLRGAAQDAHETPVQREAIEDLSREFTDRTPKSRSAFQQDRSAAAGREALQAAMSTTDIPDELFQLAHRLFSSAAPEPGRLRTVIFPAVEPKSGSPLVGAGTADALSRQTTRSVCAVDGDLRSPAPSAPFDMPGARGLSQALFDGQPLTSCLTQVRENLWLLPAGLRQLEPSPLITAPMLANMLKELRVSFDYVLIDFTLTPGAPDVSVWTSVADGAVLVIDAGVTHQEAVRRAISALRAARIDVLGSVLRNRTYPIPDAIYRHL